jgi:hypothetical protein
VKNRPSALLIAVPVVIILGGIGLSAGAVLSYNDQHSGEPGTAKVSSCAGRTGRYSGGVHCTGTWVTGGSLLEGGHVVIGDVTNADRGDIGKTIDVRIHGSDHATKPNMRVSIILALIGAPMALFGLYLLFTIVSRSRIAPTSESAAS